MRWEEVGYRCYRRRYAEFDLNVGLVLGERGALLVDTRASGTEGAELRAELRELAMSGPRWVVNTHAHFDHCFGNTAFPDARLIGHRSLPARLAATDLTAIAAEFPAWAAATAGERIDVVPPRELVADRMTIDLGDRIVAIRHLGCGHTDGDMIVAVPDADVVFAGDLVEESGPPSYGPDSHPLDWPSTLNRLIDSLTSATTVVPGHGDVVDRAFVVRQAAAVTRVAERIRELYGAGVPVDAALAADGWPFEPDVLGDAVRRGYARLATG